MPHHQGWLTGRWNRPRPRPLAAGPRPGEWPAPQGWEQSRPLLRFLWPARPGGWGRRWWSSQSVCGCQVRAPPAPGRPCGTERGGDRRFHTWSSHSVSLSSASGKKALWNLSRCTRRRYLDRFYWLGVWSIIINEPNCQHVKCKIILRSILCLFFNEDFLTDGSIKVFLLLLLL